MFRLTLECCRFQAKDFNKVGPEIKVVAANENEEVGEAKDILRVKVQRSSFGMLQTLQWAG